MDGYSGKFDLDIRAKIVLDLIIRDFLKKKKKNVN